jgi:prepilin-type N-terminal cleavage/methylation domain-containing protein
MTRRLPDRRGFTLLEVLVAVSLLGVTMATGVALFSSGVRLREVSRRHLGFDRDVRGVTTALRDDLAHLMPAGPPPMITADAIVLWRSGRTADDHRLVTYQWSGDAGQDSLLVRVALPLDIDITDPEAVEAALRHWTRLADVTVDDAPALVRRDAGRRFGDRAELDGREGAWIGWPAIRAAAWALGDDPDEYHGGDTRAHLLLRLSRLPAPEEAALPDARRRLELLPRGAATVEAGFWLPVPAVTPLPDDPDAVAEGGRT